MISMRSNDMIVVRGMEIQAHECTNKSSADTSVGSIHKRMRVLGRLTIRSRNQDFKNEFVLSLRIKMQRFARFAWNV